MRTDSLDSIYVILDKHILLVESYTEIENLSFIFKACRLKPFDYLFKSRSSKLILHKKWIDEFGNLLEIIDKKVNITYNDLSLNHNMIISTDLYYGLSMKKVFKISKLCYIYYGKDEDLYDNYIFLTLLGIDNYFRSYVYLYGEWHQVSPLLLGFDILINIVEDKDLKYFENFYLKKNLLLLASRINSG